MRNKNARNIILRNRTQILNNVKQAAVEDQEKHLRALGFIPYKDIRKEGFKKVGFDVFQRAGDIDAGNIWSIEEINGEKWLVCYTDKNDQIIRNLAKAAKTARIQKTADTKTLAGGRIITPGDLAEIQPHTAESINFKYRGHKGYVTAAMPDRSQLTFGDGSSLWVENKDLTVLRNAEELGIGDTVRMFARRDIQGHVTKFSQNNTMVHFTNDIGQMFVARANEIVKWIKTGQGTGFNIQNIWIDPTQPDAAKLLREYMKGQAQQWQLGALPESETVQPGVMSENEPTSKVPPSIKARPSQAEMDTGTAVPARDLFETPVNPELKSAANMDLVGVIKRGRTLSVGDMVQKKSTGQTGFIVDINFDRKLGKFYSIDFGGIEPVIEYDTDIQKVRPGKQQMLPPRPQEYTPTREVGPGGFRSASKIDARLMPVKEAATNFVNGLLEQARANHEAQYPGEKVSRTLEENIIKQAIETFMSRYLPVDYQQGLSAEDKNALSKEVFKTVASENDLPAESQEIPTTEDFVLPEAPRADMWDLESNRFDNVRERTAAKITSKLQQTITQIQPTEIGVLRDKQKFVVQAATAMFTRGVPKDIAHLIATQLTSFKTPNILLLTHSIKRLGFVNHVQEIFKTAADALALTTFTTTAGKKYALDLPGMETLRGGGGGYPGGVDVPPMGWEVHNPDKTQPVNNAALENALNENLENQAKPFEEVEPKINIELDPENKQIIIDYDTEDKAIELQPNTSEENSPTGTEPSPNMPLPGPGTLQPGQQNLPENPDEFNNQNIPVNF